MASSAAGSACIGKELDRGSFEEMIETEKLRTDDLWKSFHGSTFKMRWEKNEEAEGCKDLECTSVFGTLQRGCEFYLFCPSSDERAAC